MSQRISVVIPVLNDARLLELCLASLAGQDRQPDEVIVVDNGCTDDSAAVARRFGAQVIEEHRRGITPASACGFDAASGTIIARCDADSVLPRTWLAHIEDRFSAHPDAVAVTGPGRFYNLDGIPRDWRSSSTSTGTSSRCTRCWASGCPSAPTAPYEPTCGSPSAGRSRVMTARFTTTWISAIDSRPPPIGLSPLTRLLQSWGFPRPASLALTFSVVILILAGVLLLLVVPSVADQTAQMLARAETFVDEGGADSFADGLQQFVPIAVLDASVLLEGLTNGAASGAAMQNVSGGILGAGAALGYGLFLTSVVLIMTMYFLDSAPWFEGQLLAAFLPTSVSPAGGFFSAAQRP